MGRCYYRRQAHLWEAIEAHGIRALDRIENMDGFALRSALGAEYPRNLFDEGYPCSRKIEMSALDEMIDTWEDWEELVTGFRERDIDQLLIIDDVDASDNPIIMRSHDLVLGAYSWLFGDAGFGNLVVRLDDRSLDE